jgi:hypothetical protein
MLGLPTIFKGESLLISLIGGCERLIITSLPIYEQQTIVPWFIAAWVALKFAGGWKRYTEPSSHNRAIYQIAMLGNVASIGIAVIIGVLYNHLLGSP